MRCAWPSPPNAAVSNSTRAPRRARRIRADGRCSRSSPAKKRHHLGILEERYLEWTRKDPLLESRPTFLFFKGAASGLFDAGAERLPHVTDDAQALLIGIKCERGSHEFFKRYGERFEDSEGKQIFLEFADEETGPSRPASCANTGRFAAVRDGVRAEARANQRIDSTSTRIRPLPTAGASRPSSSPARRLAALTYSPSPTMTRSPCCAAVEAAVFGGGHRFRHGD
jgi:hypothetical protein